MLIFYGGKNEILLPLVSEAPSAAIALGAKEQGECKLGGPIELF